MNGKLKKCSKCGVEKPSTAFSNRWKRKDKLQSWCRKCKTASNRRWLQNPENRKRYRRTALKTKYKMSDEQVLEFATRSHCEICGELFGNDPKNKHVDHDHATEKYRGALCRKCNNAAGNVKDSAAIALKLATYLTKHCCP